MVELLDRSEKRIEIHEQDSGPLPGIKRRQPAADGRFFETRMLKSIGHCLNKSTMRGSHATNLC